MISKKWSLEKFINKATEIHGDLYDYSNSVYIGHHDKINILCKTHGVFFQRVKHHVKGAGCRKCSVDKLSKSYSAWTPEMDDFLIKNFEKEKAKFFCKKFNLCKQSIYNRIKKLNLKRTHRYPPRLHHTIPNFLWLSTIKGAQYRNFDFKISIEDVWEQFLKQNKKCALTNWKIEFTNIRNKNTASIDRIDSTKGYFKDNIQIVHKKINTLKMDFPEKELFQMCRAITNNVKTKNNKEQVLIWEDDILNDTQIPKFISLVDL